MLYRLLEEEGYWTCQSQHEGGPIKIVGGSLLISVQELRILWHDKHLQVQEGTVIRPPWRTLTLSHNSREDFQVKEEGGFFAEMTTLLDPGWSILVGIRGDYTPPEWTTLGAGGTPVVVQAVSLMKSAWKWLMDPCPNSTGGVLLTGSLWGKGSYSYPCPDARIRAYAAETGQPWQSWKRIKDRSDPNRRVQVLTPGEWLTPAGAVYLWDGDAPMEQSGPLPDPFHRDALGYGHLWLFKD
jgi:hypothetical protein